MIQISIEVGHLSVTNGRQMIGLIRFGLCWDIHYFIILLRDITEIEESIVTRFIFFLLLFHWIITGYLYGMTNSQCLEEFVNMIL